MELAFINYKNIYLKIKIPIEIFISPNKKFPLLNDYDFAFPIYKWPK